MNFLKKLTLPLFIISLFLVGFLISQKNNAFAVAIIGDPGGGSTKPTKPTNLSTAKACAGTSSNITFNWSAVGGATSYVFRLNDYRGIKIKEVPQTSPNYLLQGSAYGAYYQGWSVKACKGSSNCSDFASGNSVTSLSCSATVCKTCADLKICERVVIGPEERGAGCPTITCNSNSCGTGYHCSLNNGVCVKNATPLKDNGDDCTSPSQCKSGICGREPGVPHNVPTTCQPPPLKGNGDDCKSPSECKSGICGREAGVPNNVPMTCQPTPDCKAQDTNPVIKLESAVEKEVKKGEAATYRFTVTNKKCAPTNYNLKVNNRPDGVTFEPKLVPGVSKGNPANFTLTLQTSASTPVRKATNPYSLTVKLEGLDSSENISLVVTKAADEPPTTTCTAPEVNCNGTCRNTQTSNANCGSCGNACTTGQTCSAGTCTGGTTTCTAPKVSCNGSCVNTQTNNANCGSCGNACGTGQTCSAGTCSGGTTTCTAPEVNCNGTCRNTQTNLNNCGSCGNACGAGQTCTAGTCIDETQTCTNGTKQCSDTGVPQTCTNNDWADGAACTTGQTCSAGDCIDEAQTCTNGTKQCSDTGVPQTCTNNDWADGAACTTGQTCSAGDCIGGTTGASSLSFVVGLDDIGTTGDNSSSIYPTPVTPPAHLTRTIKVDLFEGTDDETPVYTANGTITYSSAGSTNGKFTGTVNLPDNFVAGNYVVKITVPGHLTRQIPGIQDIQAGTNTMASVNVVTGDINGNNQLDIRDYSILIGCSILNHTASDTAACNSNANYKLLSDLNDDGTATTPKVNNSDYTIFIREYGVQYGD